MVAPNGSTKRRAFSSTPAAFTPSSVSGSVALEDAVENAVINAVPMCLRYSATERRASITNSTHNTAACASRPEITASAYLASPASWAKKASPPPDAPSLEAISANTPIGAKIIIQPTMVIMASFRPSKKTITGFPLSPRVVSAAASRMQNTMIGNSFMLAAASTIFGCTRDSTRSVMPTSPISGFGAATPAPRSTPAPGCHRLAISRPMETAIKVVQA